MKSSQWFALNESPFWAYVLPFALYITLATIASWTPLQDYYPWVYALQISVVTVIWWRFRNSFPRPSTQGIGPAIVAGALGAVLWVGLCRLNLEATLSEFLPSWLAPGGRGSFDPFQSIESALCQWTFIAVRMLGLTLVVPLMEEMFWRGFLVRYLIDEKFTTVPIGRFTLLSFTVTTVLFALAHPEWTAALAWGAGINVLLLVTKNLWACIAAHAVTNCLLGVYIVSTRSWHLW